MTASQPGRGGEEKLKSLFALDGRKGEKGRRGGKIAWSLSLQIRPISISDNYFRKLLSFFCPLWGPPPPPFFNLWTNQ